MNHAFAQLFIVSIGTSLLSIAYGTVWGKDPFWIIWTAVLYACSAALAYVWWAYSGTNGEQQVWATVLLVLTGALVLGAWEMLDAPQPAWVRSEQSGEHDRL